MPADELRWELEATQWLNKLENPTIATIHLRRRHREKIESAARGAGLSNVTMDFLTSILADQARWGWHRIGSSLAEYSGNPSGFSHAQRFPGVTPLEKAQFWNSCPDAKLAEASVDKLIEQLDLAAGATILELGSGFGRVATRMAEHGFQVTGVEPDPTSVAMASELAVLKSVTPKFVSLDALEYLDTTEHSFDALVSVGCFFAGAALPAKPDDVVTLFDRIARVVRPGGRILIADCWQFDCCVRGWFGGQSVDDVFVRQFWEEEENRTFLLKEWRYIPSELKFYFRTVKLSPSCEPEGFSHMDWIWRVKEIEGAMSLAGLSLINVWGTRDWGATEIFPELTEGSWVSLLATRPR
ncbi:SAM-dependent methyltransferase [Methylomonas fluvii]|uniref:Class I SAM-dependent methyltransferase n=1 Tax=Methylomonas fluvii TaxID=1854564 RepID=A0ABR9DG52_9GAMM|nr:class I SAM-dependent methyltransferase [Methylomonas fluvii]MBD9362042.1 class I SAM-dependent methyltransferase [Methylomonas fluvii]CAD6875082.1 hypothetical protein [Methylomonas fluvii]